MRQHWDEVTFIHWSFDPEVVQSRLPQGLTVDTFDGRAWVGLVPFRMVGIAARGLPPVPYLGTFPETNIRTYVVGPDGSPGVWFDSLDASRLLPVAVARTAYRLPYYWARMRIEASAAAVSYASNRRIGNRAPSRVTVRIGERIFEPGALAEFLTARWQLFVAPGRRILKAVVAHPPWPLHRAEIVELETGLLHAAGYPDPIGDPHVLYSPGVPVRVSRPQAAE